MKFYPHHSCISVTCKSVPFSNKINRSLTMYFLYFSPAYIWLISVAFQSMPSKPKLKHTVVEILVSRAVQVRICGVWIFAQEVLPIRIGRRPQSLAYGFSIPVNCIVVLFILRCDAEIKVSWWLVINIVKNVTDYNYFGVV